MKKLQSLLYGWAVALLVLGILICCGWIAQSLLGRAPQAQAFTNVQLVHSISSIEEGAIHVSI